MVTTRDEPYIKTNGMPGMAGLVSVKPKLGASLMSFAQELLRGPSTLSAGERELIAALVSSRNDTKFCVLTHSATAARLIDGGRTTVEAVLSDASSAPVSNKMRVLFRVAEKVQRSGLEVSPEDIEAARAAGCADEDIHDAVLVAAAFSMFNRYVDGLAALTPDDKEIYEMIGEMLATTGYARSEA